MPPVRLLAAQSCHAPCTAASPQVRAGHGHRQPKALQGAKVVSRALMTEAQEG